jgi:hypothetical protein
MSETSWVAAGVKSTKDAKNRVDREMENRQAVPAARPFAATVVLPPVAP